jgi:hypothetical protein
MVRRSFQAVERCIAPRVDTSNYDADYKALGGKIAVRQALCNC